MAQIEMYLHRNGARDIHTHASMVFKYSMNYGAMSRKGFFYV